LTTSRWGTLHNFFRDDLTVKLPIRSGRKANLDQVADELRRRPLSLLVLDANGGRPAGGANSRLQKDSERRDASLL
jgi:hypothetical protein